MAGEPWCFSPAEVAPLTDYQIDEVYLKPAVKRAEAMERERQGLPPRPTPGADVPDAPPPRGQVVAFAMSTFGKTRAQAEAEYDAQLAAWEQQQKG
jgi:hypothetical protein